MLNWNSTLVLMYLSNFCLLLSRGKQTFCPKANFLFHLLKVFYPLTDCSLLPEAVLVKSLIACFRLITTSNDKTAAVTVLDTFAAKTGGLMVKDGSSVKLQGLYLCLERKFVLLSVILNTAANQ